MNWFKRSIIYIKRNLNKGLLLFLIIFFLGNVLAGAFSILQGSYQVEQMVKKRLPAALAVDIDTTQTKSALEKDPDFWTKGDFYMASLDQLEQIGESHLVDKFDIRLEITAGSEYYQAWLDPFYAREQDDQTRYIDFKLAGTNYPAVLEIEQGAWQLIEGRTFTQEEVDSGAEVGLITQNFAEVNQLKLGDTMVVSVFQMDYSQTTPQVLNQIDVPLKIIGLYQPKEPPAQPTEAVEQMVDGKLVSTRFADKDGYHYDGTKQMQENRIIAPAKLVNDTFQADMLDSVDVSKLTPYQLTNLLTPEYHSVYILKDPSEVDRFIEETTPLLPKYYTFFENDNNYDDISAPLKQASDLAQKIMLATVVASALIVSLVVVLFLKDRRFELGILRSLGESQTKISAQILLEMLLIASFAIAASLITGQLIARALSDSMISSELQAIEYIPFLDDNYFWARYRFGDLSGFLEVDDIVSHYVIEFSPRYILLYSLLGLGTIFLAALGPVLYILRLNPKQILT